MPTATKTNIVARVEARCKAPTQRKKNLRLATEFEADAERLELQLQSDREMDAELSASVSDVDSFEVSEQMRNAQARLRFEMERTEREAKKLRADAERAALSELNDRPAQVVAAIDAIHADAEPLVKEFQKHAVALAKVYAKLAQKREARERLLHDLRALGVNSKVTAAAPELSPCPWNVGDMGDFLEQVNLPNTTTWTDESQTRPRASVMVYSPHIRPFPVRNIETGEFE